MTARRHRGPAVLAALAVAFAAGAGASPPWPPFTARALTGESVDSSALIGQPTLLIVTPSAAASDSTHRWVDTLKDRIDSEQVRVRDLIAIDLPFFISVETAVERAREQVPAKYHDRTWLLDSPAVERALRIPPDSTEACIVLLDRDGNLVRRIHGAPNAQRLASLQEGLRTLGAAR